jgi:Ca2+-binding RTX toxin-like protein
VLIGSSNGDSLLGKGGNDVLKARGRRNRLVGGGGRDRLLARPKRNTLHQ